MRRKQITNFYTEPTDDVYISNIVNSRSNFISIVLVPRSSSYVPPYENRFLDCDYMPDIRLISKEFKSTYNYYIFDVNFVLPDKDTKITNELIDQISASIFNLNIEK